MGRALTLILLLMATTVGFANEAKVVFAKFKKTGAKWIVAVTLRHNDTGWKHYADAWRVVDAKGKVLGTRTLYHPHEDEQPFTRSLGGVVIPAGTHIVYVEAHDKVHGWNKHKLKVDMRVKKAKGYKIE